MDHSRWCTTVLAIMLVAAAISCEITAADEEGENKPNLPKGSGKAADGTATLSCTILISGKREANFTCHLPNDSKTISIRRTINGSHPGEHFLDCERTENGALRCVPEHIPQFGPNKFSSQINWTDGTFVVQLENCTDDDQKYSYFCESPPLLVSYEMCPFPAEPLPPTSSNSSGGPTSTRVPSQVTPTTSQNVLTQTTVPSNTNSSWSSPGAIVGYVLSVGVLGLLLSVFLEKKFKAISRLGCRLPFFNGKSSADSALSHYDLQVDGEGCESKLDFPNQREEESKHQPRAAEAQVHQPTPSTTTSSADTTVNMPTSVWPSAEAQVHQPTPSTTTSSADTTVNPTSEQEEEQSSMTIQQGLRRRIKEQDATIKALKKDRENNEKEKKELKKKCSVLEGKLKNAKKYNEKLQNKNSTDEPKASAVSSMTTPTTCTQTEQPSPDSVVTYQSTAKYDPAMIAARSGYSGLPVNESNEQRVKSSGRPTDIRKPALQGCMPGDTDRLLPGGQ